MSDAFIKATVLVTSMATVFASGCSSDDDDDAAGSSIDGLRAIDSAVPVDEAMGNLLTALNNVEAITALPLIDHQANAPADLDETLRPTSVQLFGNPALGTPLMQVNQLAGIDLPQKILAWENEDGLTQIAYNNVAYLQQRHNIVGNEAADTALANINGALNNFSFVASGNTGEAGDAPEATASVAASAGIRTVTSEQDMAATYTALIAAIGEIAALNIFAEVNHTTNAANVGLALDPTQLVIFGNPNAGTPLMLAEQTIGIDLPQKMLVFEDAAGVVTVAYNDPVFLAARHGITSQDDRLSAISSLLASLANSAAGITEP